MKIDVDRFATGVSGHAALFHPLGLRPYHGARVGGNEPTGFEVMHSNLPGDALCVISRASLESDGFRSGTLSLRPRHCADPLRYCPMRRGNACPVDGT